MEAAIERLFDDEAPGIVGDVVNANNVLVVVGREDLLGLGIALMKRVRVCAKQYRNSLLRPVILVAEPDLEMVTFIVNSFGKQKPELDRHRLSLYLPGTKRLVRELLVSPESVRHNLSPVFGGEPKRVCLLSLAERHAELVRGPLNRRDGDDV